MFETEPFILSLQGQESFEKKGQDLFPKHWLSR